MPELVIQTHELTKNFTHPFFFWQVKARALTGLNLAVERGEIFGLLGPNGSGKSTTIKLLLGMLWPTSGEIAVFARRPRDVQVKHKIGYLPEETNLYRFLNAEETLDFYGRIFGLPYAERRKRVETLLELTGLRHVRNRPLGEFSKGMQRRIGLAQALINDPELVILDEPTSGLDPLGTREIKNLILELKAKKKTVLLCSHLLDDVEDVCDRVAILYGGKVRAMGAVSELLCDESRTTVAGVFPPGLQEKIIEDVRAFHAEEAVKITPARERLETLFLRIVREAEEQKIATSGAGLLGSQVDFLTSHIENADPLAALAASPQPASSAPAAEPEITPAVFPAGEHKLDLGSLTVPAVQATAGDTPKDREAAAVYSVREESRPAVRELDTSPDFDLLNSLTSKK